MYPAETIPPVGSGEIPPSSMVGAVPSAARPALQHSNLGWDKVKATAPVFAGDTLYAESTILQKRESKSRPTQGIVTVETRGINQQGTVVMTFERTMLVYKRGHSPEAAAGY